MSPSKATKLRLELFPPLTATFTKVALQQLHEFLDLAVSWKTVNVQPHNAFFHFCDIDWRADSMATSRKASVISTNAAALRKPSTSSEHYQRQASVSLRLEEGRSLRPPLLRDEDVSRSFLQNYSMRQNANEPTTLTRADTTLSPLEEYADQHPGEKWGARRPTETLQIIPVPGVFQKPFAEPDDDQEVKLQQQWSASKKVVAHPTLDPEAAQLRIQRLASDAKKRRGLVSRLYRQLSGQNVIKPGAFSGLEFMASLPTAHANAVLSQVRDTLDQSRAVFVLEYKKDANNALSSAPPYPLQTVDDLKQYLEDPGHISELRLIWTCNYEEAVSYLSSEYGISASRTQSGERSFREWMHESRSYRRAANKAIRWRPAHDRARELICTAFALDFGRMLVPAKTTAASRKYEQDSQKASLLESRQRQRISVYLQRPASSPNPSASLVQFNSGTNSLPPFAASPTIIVSEYISSGASASFSPLDMLALNVHGLEPSQMIVQVMQGILQHVTSGVRENWQSQIDLLHEPHAELEDHIWSQPADSSRARKVWSMSQRLRSMLKHINRHASLFGNIEEDFGSFAERKDRQSWLEDELEEFRHLALTVDVDYIQPLEHMIDLMYKSVTIRDSRQSLELNASLWRLSWITFVSYIPRS